MARSPRAPVPRLSALRATARSADSSKVIFTSSRSNSRPYCLVSAFFGSLRICTSVSSSSASSGTHTGSRPTSSGMIPKRSRSSGSTSAKGDRDGAAFAIGRTRPSGRSSPNPIVRRPVRASMIFSSPSNAPPQMNRMSFVLIWMYSCCGCLRPPCGGTLATVPSRILSSACCTPSPDTSRVMLGFSDFRAILSISSMYTMPRSHSATLKSPACSSRTRMFSTSSPTYPASVSVVASAMVNGTSRMRASVWASSVFPTPVGPMSRMFDLSSSASSSRADPAALMRL